MYTMICFSFAENRNSVEFNMCVFLKKENDPIFSLNNALSCNVYLFFWGVLMLDNDEYD